MSSFPSVRLCSHPIHDVEVDYQTKFEEMPGVFHVPSPLWDERTVSCSAEQLNRFLHTLQFHGSKKGLILNEDKCEHLRLHSPHRIYLYSPHVATSCQCKYCGGIHSPATLALLSDEVKYLGVYLDPTNNNRKNTSRRVSQAVSASKLLKPLLSRSCLPPSWKLTVYRSIVLSILTYAMDSVLLTSPRYVKLDAIHNKSVRRSFKIKQAFVLVRQSFIAEVNCKNSEFLLVSNF